MDFNIEQHHTFIIITIIVLFIILLYMWSNTTPTTEGYSEQTAQTAPILSEQEQMPPKEIVLYYATWCGHSKNFLPEWEKFVNYAKTNLPDLKVTTVRCEGGAEAQCMQKGVKGYPTVILYVPTGQEYDFRGQRTFNELVKFANSYK